MKNALKNKKIIIFFLVSLLAFLGIYGYKTWKAFFHHSRHFSAQPNIAIVNLAKIRSEAKAFTNFRELIERQYKIFHTEIIEQENQLRNRYSKIKLVESTSASSDPSLKIQKEQLDKEVQQLEKTIKQRKDKLSQYFEEINQEIESKLQEIVNRIAQDRNLNLILNATIMDTSVVLHGRKELDISEEVVAKLNKELPTVHLPSS
jgi:Skp family chaperone for outer membrane proteins